MSVTRAHGLAVAAALVAAAGACVVQPGGGTFMCHANTDCDSGEVCGEDHVCYGNPPNLPLMAVLASPTDRADLVVTEQTLGISQTGDFTLEYVAPAEISGRVVLTTDPSTSVAAKLVFRRPSRVPGGPDVVVIGESRAGVLADDPNGNASFKLLVPPTQPGESYEVTIFPDDGQLTPPMAGQPTAAQLVAPYRQIGVEVPGKTTNVVFPLGNGANTAKRIEGRVLDAANRGITGYTVRAFGRFSPLGELELASSRGTTDAEGRFSISVPIAWLDDFEVRFTPPTGFPLPEVVRRHVHVDDPPAGQSEILTLPDILLPAYPAPLDFMLPLTGAAPNGGLDPVGGATVRLVTILAESEDLSFFLRAQSVAGTDGVAIVPLIPGTVSETRRYLLDVIPPPDSPIAQLWGIELDVSALGGELPLAPLPARVLVTGTVVDFDGAPAEDISVRAVPSLGFGADVRTATGVNLADAAWPEAVTESDGRFVIYLDPDVAGIAARYHVDLVPRPGSLLPLASIDDLGALADDTGSLDLGEMRLPDAAYARGSVRDPVGVLVPGARVDVYEVVDLGVLCALFALDACDARAPLRASASTDSTGQLRLVLPRP